MSDEPTETETAGMENLGMISSGLPGHLIRRLHQHSTQVFLQRVREANYDTTPVQFAALDALRHCPGIDQAGLAARIGKDRATTGAVLNRLEQKKLVTRTVDNRDRRARELSLTQAGEAELTALLGIVVDLQKEILPGLDATEYRQFMALAIKALEATKD